MADTRLNPSFRGLKALVIGMGAAIIIGVVVLGVAVFQRSETLVNAEDEAGVAGLASFDTRRMALPAGTEIVETRAEGNRLILRLGGSTGEPERILVVDLTTGRLLGTLVLERE